MKRTIAFFVLIAVFAVGLYEVDRQAMFVYMPYGIALAFCLILLAPLAIRGPWILKAAVLAAFAAAVLFALPRLRSSELKSFYVDVWSLESGMTLAQVDEIMAPYEKNSAGPLSEAFMVGAPESPGEHSSRIVYTHKDHPADWCVVYPAGDSVQRIVVHPD
jgi:hypothetical protein